MQIGEKKENTWLASSGDFLETEIHDIGKILFLWMTLLDYIFIYHFITVRNENCTVHNEMQLGSREGRGSCLHGWSLTVYCEGYQKKLL